MTTTDVKGFGTTGELYRGAEYVVDFLPGVLIEIVLPDQSAEIVIELILSNARTGKHGDGIIFVTKVDEAIRLRTNERGDMAL